MVVHEGTGHLFVATPSAVLMLDVHTGRVLTRIPTVAPVTAMAVAERTSVRRHSRCADPAETSRVRT